MDQQQIEIEVLKEKLSDIAGALIAMLEDIESGVIKHSAPEIRAIILGLAIE